MTVPEGGADQALDVGTWIVAGAGPEDGHPGGGLGLALAQRLATACRGSLSCRAHEGGGRFEITLPQAEARLAPGPGIVALYLVLVAIEVSRTHRSARDTC